ncbi:MAG: translation initiation factor IF-2 [Bacillota bacterium]|nr:translation initiation factor IF-2 [Bacillota bacterium]
MHIHSKEILDFLHNEMNIDINNHMSTINDRVAARIRREFAGRAAQGQQAGARGGARQAAVGPVPEGQAAQGRGQAPSAPAAAGPAASGDRRSQPAPPRAQAGAAPGAGAGGATRPAAPAPRPARPQAEGGPRPGGGADRAGGARRPQGAAGPARAGHGPGPQPGGRAEGAGGRPRGNGAAPRTGTAAGGRPAPGGFRGGAPRPGGAPRGAGGGPGAGAGHPGGGRPGGAGGRFGGGRAPAAGGRPAAAGQRGRPARRGRGGGRPEPERDAWRDGRTIDLEEERRAPKGPKQPGRRKRSGAERLAQIQVPAEIELADGTIGVSRLAEKLHLPTVEVVKRLVAMGVMASAGQEIPAETAARVAEAFGSHATIRRPEKILSDEELLQERLSEAASSGVERPPVVVVLGHVDHGKTSLLDAIRETRVAASEAGGITQHIGASTVEQNGRRIVFLDTPGHEAFTAMRARGAQIGDVAILVVAADDGIMPQTVEAIQHARAAGLPIVVALNKIDKPNANPDRVKQQLAEQGLVPEEWGGETVVVPVSALKRQGIDELLEMVLLVADMQELRANREGPAIGTVIEARLDRGLGPVASVLVQDGTLRQGQPFVAGAAYGHVRSMTDDRGRSLEKAGPGTPVEISGFATLPMAGDVFRVVEDERTAREIALSRQEEAHEAEIGGRQPVTLATFFARQAEGGRKQLRVVLKADVQGTLEALRGSLGEIRNDEVSVDVIHAAVGGVNESDIMLAAASDAIVIGFNVRPDTKAAALAQEQKVEVKTYRVIYELLDDVKKAVTGLLAPRTEERVIGRAEVRQTFRVPDAGTVAGCYVQEGLVRRNAGVRLVREGVVVYEGKIASLRRFKEDVREVAQGYECGVGLERFDDIKVGDVLEVFEIVEVAR